MILLSFEMFTGIEPKKKLQLELQSIQQQNQERHIVMKPKHAIFQRGNSYQYNPELPSQRSK